MAQVEMTREQASDPECWPKVCVCCGEPAAGQLLVPERYAGRGHPGGIRIPEDRPEVPPQLLLPVCAHHADYYRQHFRVNILASVLVLGVMLLVGVLVLLLAEPFNPAHRWQPDALVNLIVLSLLLTVLLGLPLALWLGTTIRVSEEATHWITLTGVCRAFAEAWRQHRQEELAMDDSEETLSFPVRPYQPDNVAPWPGVLWLFLWAIGVGLVGGWYVGTQSLNLAAMGGNFQGQTALLYIAMLLGTFAVLFWAFFDVPGNTWVVLGVLLLAALVLTGCAGLLAFLPALPLAKTYSVMLHGLPPLFVLLLVNYLVKRYQVRNGLLAALAGILGPALLTTMAVWWIHESASFDWTLVVVGGLATLGAPFLCFGTAREPFCAQCDTWMQRDLLGGLSRPSKYVCELLAEGELVRLANEQVRESADVGDVELAVHYCSTCQDTGDLVLHAQAVRREGRNVAQKELGKWIYPGEAWETLQELFPNWRREPDEEE